MEKYKFLFTIDPTSNPILLDDSTSILGEEISLLRDEEDGKDTQLQFSSIHLNELDDPIVIWSRGESLRRIYLGVNAILLGYFDDPNKPSYFFRLSNLYKGSERITPNNIEPTIPMFPYSSIETKMSTDITSQLIFLSKTNKDILALLLQFGTGSSWINLYSILDTLKYYSGLKKIDIIKMTNVEDNVKAFTGMANNFGLLGINARHGEVGWSKPQKSITLKDAIYTIISLARTYLNEVYKFNIPTLNKPDDVDSIWTFDFHF
ncbi:MAG: hypothetical protein NVV82_00395 [Sporocytophaga sp.]|nr:hypothetical protein [Sporocytophaga sp.]